MLPGSLSRRLSVAKLSRSFSTESPSVRIKFTSRGSKRTTPREQSPSQSENPLEEGSGIKPGNAASSIPSESPPNSIVRQKKPVEAPQELLDGLKRILHPHSLRRVANDFEKLAKDTSDFERGESIKIPTYDSRRSIAYLAFRTLPAFGVIKASLQRALEAGFALAATQDKVIALDFGSGPGTASWALWDALQLKQANIPLEVTFVESSLPMIDASLQLADKTFAANWCRNILELARSSSKHGASRFDVVMATFALGDLPSDEARQIVVDLLWNAVAPDGLMLIVERGNGRGSHIVGTARKQILAGGSNFNTDKLMMNRKENEAEQEDTLADVPTTGTSPHVLAPCGHERPCPLLRLADSYGANLDPDRLKKHEYCHFVQSTSRLLKATTADSSVPHRMNYSYVVIQKRQQVEGGLPQVPAREQQFRVLRKPRRNVRHVVLELCSPDEGEGGVKQQTVTHSDRARYRIAKKVQWGETFGAAVGKKSKTILGVPGSATSSPRRRGRRHRSSLQ